MDWELPPPRIRELIRQGAQVALDPPAEWLEELDRATLAGEPMKPIAEDPVLNAATRRTNRSNLLFWATANVRDPGARVPANLGDAPLAIARDLIRRGLNEFGLDAYRIGQGVALRMWMQIVFSLTSDPEELRQVLDVSCRSIAAFVDDTIAAIAAQMDLEREELTRGSHAERREVVSLLLDGAPIARSRAEARLGYALAPQHTAAVVWSDQPEPDLGQLDRAAELLGQDGRPLTVIASAATRWVWVHGRPAVEGVAAQLRALPAVRVALGSTAGGVDGFRRSHLDALLTQRMLARLSPSHQVACFDDVELVSLLTQGGERADAFVQRTLGALEQAPAEVGEAVRVYIAELGNASRAATRLFTHRNTLLRRLARADALLPRPLAEQVLPVAAALEIVRWRG